MKINRKGVTRIVIEFKTTVWKIPNFTCQWSHFLHGLIGNLNEGRTHKWNTGEFDKGTGHLLCPVVWFSWGGWILVMRKAKMFTDIEFNDPEKYPVSEHKKHFPGDDTISNYGIFEGRVVKVDYADLDNSWGEDFDPNKRNIL